MKKMLMAALAVVLIVVISVSATFAYLTSQDTVVNTFTVGNVVITLDEAKVTELGVQDGTTRVDANEYKLLPGHEYLKDPTVHVAAGSEDCWIFVKVENGIADIEAAGDTTIAKQLETNGWTLVGDETNVYAYKKIVKAEENVLVFGKFIIDGTVDNTAIAAYENAKVTVTAYAVQADGFDTAAEAWTAAKGQLTTPPTTTPDA